MGADENFRWLTNGIKAKTAHMGSRNSAENVKTKNPFEKKESKNPVEKPRIFLLKNYFK